MHSISKRNTNNDRPSRPSSTKNITVYPYKAEIENRRGVKCTDTDKI
jgi:hypothetical protein